ncbi:hypothetical protein EG68_06468 [Paragonimus skrjabini miyazakii]|uniref:Uncharacterized protein n=1 Tax=Paragonimus skrjabini miyazakii TaxID=59628 RepID=A0A8S9YSY6_9TREM|nr:hypothetical protein EG68_06468 [Paragonimus skrjabini miyazakii]
MESTHLNVTAKFQTSIILVTPKSPLGLKADNHQDPLVGSSPTGNDNSSMMKMYNLVVVTDRSYDTYPLINVHFNPLENRLIVTGICIATSSTRPHFKSVYKHTCVYVSSVIP